MPITASLNVQELQGTVTGVSFSLGGGGGGASSSGGAGAMLTTGGITGATYSGFGGILTSNQNTGLASLNQATTGVAANANVTFGAP